MHEFRNCKIWTKMNANYLLRIDEIMHVNIKSEFLELWMVWESFNTLKYVERMIKNI